MSELLSQSSQEVLGDTYGEILITRDTESANDVVQKYRVEHEIPSRGIAWPAGMIRCHEVALVVEFTERNHESRSLSFRRSSYYPVSTWPGIM